MSESVFLPQEVIRLKRDQLTLPEEDIQKFVAGIADGSVADAQIAALGMAIFLNGMSAEEGAALTLAMRDSGTVIDWQEYGFDKDAPITDKHSTGGVGDKVSLPLAPIVAACGGFVPMISGRGLGHSGGTLDKLESIAGFNPYPSPDRFAEIVKDVGAAIIGQTGDLAPADKRFYAVRDVTSTVESIPLITASILSKKLAAGLNSLVMDVKFGTGAFMPTFDLSKELATNIARVANAAGTPTSALLTDMNQVLGTTAGNALEVVESIDMLVEPAKADKRLVDVTLALAARMLTLSGLATDDDMGRDMAEGALASGAAAEVFGKMAAAQAGPSDLMDTYRESLIVAPVASEAKSLRSGYVSGMDTRAIGMAVVAMGGGRTDPAQDIDHSVGFSAVCQIGDKVEAGDVFALVHHADSAKAERAAEAFLGAVTLSQEPPEKTPIVAEII